MDQNLINRLKDIQIQTEAILIGIEPVPNWDVNWGDLRCVRVSYCLDNFGDEYYLVEIEEALEPELDVYIYERLSEWNPNYVFEVRSEW